jgi:alkanesulfonate monooxygenase SsuD/methylene tetrahydromethanopterin reductase-like flavin-dependent oxidoreductase (luciferase family)
MKAIWTQDEASYDGKHVAFERIWCWPKPVQNPHPPVLVGGNGETVLDRVIRFGDEWMPNRIGTDDAMIERCNELARRAEQAGRAPIPVTIAGMMRDPARIERFEQAGVHRSLFWLPSSGSTEVEQAMDRYAAAAEQYQSAGV